MMKLNVVLFQPQIPQNCGNVARTCAVTGAALHLVGPMGFAIDDAKLKRAGLDYWHYLDITVYTGADDFFRRTANREYVYFTSKGIRAHSGISYPDGVFLIFGSETNGLPEDLLFANPGRSVRIPMLSEVRCLNLSSAAAVGIYEVLRQWEYPQLSANGRLVQYDWTDTVT